MLLSLGFLLLVSGLGDGHRRHSHHGMLLPPPNLNNDPLPPDQWFTQRLDHSQP